MASGTKQQVPHVKKMRALTTETFQHVYSSAHGVFLFLVAQGQTCISCAILFSAFLRADSAFFLTFGAMANVERAGEKNKFA